MEYILDKRKAISFLDHGFDLAELLEYAKLTCPHLSYSTDASYYGKLNWINGDDTTMRYIGLSKQVFITEKTATVYCGSKNYPLLEMLEATEKKLVYDIAP